VLLLWLQSTRELNAFGVPSKRLHEAYVVQTELVSGSQTESIVLGRLETFMPAISVYSRLKLL
jgi:hypothetical protein